MLKVTWLNWPVACTNWNSNSVVLKTNVKNWLLPTKKLKLWVVCLMFEREVGNNLFIFRVAKLRNNALKCCPPPSTNTATTLNVAFPRRMKRSSVFGEFSKLFIHRKSFFEIFLHTFGGHANRLLLGGYFFVVFFLMVSSVAFWFLFDPIRYLHQYPLIPVHFFGLSRYRTLAQRRGVYVWMSIS